MRDRLTQSERMTNKRTTFTCTICMGKLTVHKWWLWTVYLCCCSQWINWNYPEICINKPLINIQMRRLLSRVAFVPSLWFVCSHFFSQITLFLFLSRFLLSSFSYSCCLSLSSPSRPTFPFTHRSLPRHFWSISSPIALFSRHFWSISSPFALFPRHFRPISSPIALFSVTSDLSHRTLPRQFWSISALLALFPNHLFTHRALSPP